MTDDSVLRLHVLGSGCPQPTPTSYGSAFVLEAGDEALMVDCGPATTWKMAHAGLPPGRVGHVFLTHHHFDHNADLPAFVLTRWDQGIGDGPPLKVYGPPPTRAFVAKLFGEKDGAFYDDWYSRVMHPASQELHMHRGGTLPRPPPAIEAEDVGPGPVTGAANWSVTAARVHHVEPWLDSLVYRFETPRGSVLFAGDCGDCDELRRMAKGVDTLVVACTHFGQLAPAVADVITGTQQVAEMAREGNVKCTILTHVSPNFAKPGVKDRAVAEIARDYAGIIVFPEELEVVDLD